MAGIARLLYSFSVIALGGLLFGYIIGINGNIVTSGQLICPDDWTGDVGTWTSAGYGQCYKLSALEMGFLSSLNLIGACLSSIFCFRFADNMGRKLEVQVAACFYFVGAVVAATSQWLVGIYVGFTLYGIGIGFAMHAAPVYIAEIAPANIRGTLVSAKEACIVLGIFLGFLFGWVFSSWEYNGWRYMVGISASLALLVEAGIAVVPQSPRFLVLKAVQGGGPNGYDDELMEEAGRALQWLRREDPSIVRQELEAMRDDIVAAVGNVSSKWHDAFKYPRPLQIGCGIVFLQQVTGQPSVLYFATNIFKSAGFGNTAALSSVGVGLVKLLATLFTVWRVDQYGRRFLLFIGIGMMAAALALISVAFMFRECQVPGVDLAQCSDSDVGLPKPWAFATVGGLMVYVSGYQVGFGPIAWLLIAEVFPLQARGAALSLAAVVNFGSNISMTLTQQVLQDALTPAGVFVGYFVLSLVSLAFVKFVVPETKGKTLEQIERQLAAPKSTDIDSPLESPVLGA